VTVGIAGYVLTHSVFDILACVRRCMLPAVPAPHIVAVDRYYEAGSAAQATVDPTLAYPITGDVHSEIAEWVRVETTGGPHLDACEAEAAIVQRERVRESELRYGGQQVAVPKHGWAPLRQRVLIHPR
jgi:hypothetical protein